MLIRLRVTVPQKYLKASSLEKLQREKKATTKNTYIALLCSERAKETPLKTCKTESLGLESAIGRARWLKIEEKTDWKMDPYP